MWLKNFSIAILISATYIPIWGLNLLDADTVENFSVCIGIFYSIVAIYYFKNLEVIKNLKYGELYLLIFPLFYFISTTIIFRKNSVFIYNPILWAFISLIISFKFLNSIHLRELFFIIFASYLYGYHIYPIFKNYVTDDKFSVVSIEEKDITLNKNIQAYSFVNYRNDTLILKPQRKFTLIETWNESCAPCVAAMSDLQPTFDSLNTYVDHRYLYENGSQKQLLTNLRIFSFPRITDKSKILMDVDNKFFEDSKMASFPYFLLFDDRGKLIDYFKGYDSRFKDYFTKRISEMVKIK